MKIKYKNDGQFIIPDRKFHAIEEKDALKESIKKWEWIAEWIKTNRDGLISGTIKPLYAGTNSCALCSFYFDHDCEGCPVFNKTDLPICDETPYQSYTNFIDEYNSESMLSGEEKYNGLLKSAEDEVKFLKSLQE